MALTEARLISMVPSTHRSGDDAVAGIDGRGLAKRDVFGFGFGDADRGFEVVLPGNFGESSSGLDVLSGFEGAAPEGIAELLALTSSSGMRPSLASCSSRSAASWASL